jgi:hypothetical protein
VSCVRPSGKAPESRLLRRSRFLMHGGQSCGKRKKQCQGRSLCSGCVHTSLGKREASNTEHHGTALHWALLCYSMPHNGSAQRAHKSMPALPRVLSRQVPLGCTHNSSHMMHTLAIGDCATYPRFVSWDSESGMVPVNRLRSNARCLTPTPTDTGLSKHATQTSGTQGRCN